MKPNHFSPSRPSADIARNLRTSFIAPRHFLVLPLALLLAPLGVLADDLDTLTFQAGQSLLHDSNVFRLSDSANSQAVLGTPGRSDTVMVSNLGIKLNKSYSLQRFELEAELEDHHYGQYSNLNFTAVNYAAAWRWSVTPALHGNLTSDRREYVDNAADVQNIGQLNRRTNRSTVLDAEYEIDGVWRVLGGVSERTSTSSLRDTFEGDSRIRGAETGVRYVFPSGTSMAYRFKKGNGDYTSGSQSPLFASSFNDTEHEARLDWAPSGRTTVQARLAHFDRSHPGLATRDYSGLVGQVNATWAVTGKTSIMAGAAQELGSYQTTTASYYQGRRLFIAPTWKPTEKTAVRLRYDHGVRDFKGALPGFTNNGRRDRTNLLLLAYDWQVIRALKLTASVQRDTRKSSEPGFNYQSNAFGISAQASF